MAQTPSSSIQLSLSCRDVKKMDYFSESDPLVCLMMFDQINNRWFEVGRTEMLKDQRNADFVKKIKLDYYFEEVQYLKFIVYDIDYDKGPLDRNDLIGEVNSTVAEVVTAPNQNFQRPIKHSGANHGTLIVRSEEINSENMGELILEMAATKLPKMDWFGKSDPYLLFLRANEDQSWSPAFKTEIIKNTLTPRWKPMRIPTTDICNNDFYRPIRIQCYDWNKRSEDELIGEVQTDVDTLLSNGNSPWEKPLQNKKSSRKNNGNLKFLTASFKKIYSFYDYIAGGCEINLIVGVDFTASNGPVNNPNSLHFTGGQYANPYQSAIRSVGDILGYYDSDQLFPVFGFGAKMPNGQVSHCFALNGSDANPDCERVDGMLAAYQQALGAVTLWGPTLFAPIIRTAAQYASAQLHQQNQAYTILLMITDGVITDMDNTIEEIIKGSNLPLSIVIVGVGNEDFTAMEQLDSDEQLLRSRMTNAVASRDIVQFVPLRDFVGKPPSYLTKETLQELPEQLTSYMHQRNIIPQGIPQ
eukprot:gb/GECH01013723.1/.p1 GENE.gb/GECH01013723.1/~~gb/GECH01013723.1/.p1  ORF type:complete len:527 (+),score=120.13 gb/GECH01013723.1/:1-1581(+)